MKISHIYADEILDSRGNPTVEAITVLEDGSQGWAAVPSGASTGKYEAVELRDSDPTRYTGMGVLKAVENVNTKILGVLKGIDAEDQRKVDQTMIALDNTPNKSNLGANAMLAVSLSAARAEAISEKKILYEYLTKFNPDFKGKYIMPIVQMNVMNGGRHANWTTDIQEYMLFPIGAKSVVDAIRMNAEVYSCIRSYLKTHGYSITVGDEGGFAPSLQSNEEPFQIMTEAIKMTSYTLGKDIYLGIDAAASEFFQDGVYTLHKDKATLSGTQLMEFYKSLLEKYPIIYMEDIFSQDDWSSFSTFMALYGDKMQVVGDDLYATNVSLLQKGINQKATNSIIIKLNQIGTLTETIDAILLARQHGMNAIVSHRSGETEDAFIADFVVAMGTGQIKTGAPARSERTAKYNRLMRIEKELSDKSEYANCTYIQKNP